MFVNDKHATEESGTQQAATAMMNWEGNFLFVKKNKLRDRFSVCDTAIFCLSMALWQLLLLLWVIIHPLSQIQD